MNEQDSIHYALSRRLHEVSNDYFYRFGKAPKLRFVIGREWWQRIVEHIPTFPCKDIHGLAPSEVLFEDARGYIHPTLDGFIIRLLE